ncbi:hypothetical protein PGB90_005357 [Kerria lacca]
MSVIMRFVLCLLNLGIIKSHVIVDDFGRTTKCESYTYISTDLDKFDMTDEMDLQDFESPADTDTNTVSCKPNNLNFCFVLWSNDSNDVIVKKKGCFSDDSKCVGKNTCVNYEKKSNLHFCCCEGDLCNKHFFYEPYSPHSSAPIDDEILDNNNHLSVVALLFYVGIPIFIVVLICNFIYPKCSFLKKNNLSTLISRTSPSSSVEKLCPIELINMKMKGRFGEVWKAKYKNNFVAVKIIPVQYRDLWTTEKEIFKLPFMNHENILQFIGAEKQDSGVQPGYWIITAGLTHLHEEISSQSQNYYKPSIAHRDFKSANVLLKNDLTVCIADFGFALTFRSPVCTESHEQIGTKRYMAPEILEGSVGFSNNSFLCMDMYSCGLVLWEILTRCTVHEVFEKKYQLPYEAELGDNPTIEDLRELVGVKKKRPVLKDSWKTHNLLSHVCEIIEECWDSDAEARLSSACVMERFCWYLNSISKE